MNYTIFSIDDRRRHYTDAIRQQLGNSFWWNEVPTYCYDGSDETDLINACTSFQYAVRAPGIKKGQLGIWYTVLQAMYFHGDDPFVTFEDDAILHPAFNDIFWMVTSELPRDTDAFALFLPRDQDHVWEPRMSRGNHISVAYQRYGGVSMLWTPRGVRRFQDLIRRDGITDQWDDQLFKYAKSGEMSVYTQKPSSPILVEITGQEESIVQESEVFA